MEILLDIFDFPSSVEEQGPEITINFQLTSSDDDSNAKYPTNQSSVSDAEPVRRFNIRGS